MHAHVSPLIASPRAPDRACVGHARRLDAWLSLDAPTPERAPAPAPLEADWDAPPLEASLVYDTGIQGLPAGIRVVVQAGSRRLMFAADEYEIVLRVASDGPSGRGQVVGQLLYEGLPLAGVPVRLRGEGSPHLCLTDRAGAFRAAPLADGFYHLEVPIGDRVLTASPIWLGHPRE